MRESQTNQILSALEQGRSLTPLDALQEFGSMRLGARIYDLKQAGYNIVTEMVTKNNKQFASYRMER